MDNELLTAILLGVGAIGFGAGAAWQMIRRKPAKTPRRVERMAARREEPAKAKVVETPARPPEMGVLRPSMLAVTPVAGDVTAAELFLQRAHEGDLPFYRKLETEAHDLRGVEGLFTRCPALAWTPEDDWAHDVYTVSFSPVVAQAWAAGHMPRVNATSMDLQVMALGEGGAVLGTPMGVADHEWGDAGLIQTLWELMNPAEREHELAGEVRNEIAEIDARLPKVRLMATALHTHEWENLRDELFDMLRDANRLGAEEGRATDRIKRLESIARFMRAKNAEIDATFDQLAASIKTAREADDALTQALPLTYERELSVLFLRAVALLRVITGDDYTHGMRCSNRIALNVKEFPDMHKLLDKARHIALDTLTHKSRALSDPELKVAADVKKDADMLAAAHDEVLGRLEKDVERLQTSIDRYLILQGGPPRFAVRLDGEGRLESLLVLEH